VVVVSIDKTIGGTIVAYKGIAKYNARLFGYIWEPIELICEDPRITKILVTADEQNDNVVIECHIVDVMVNEDVQAITSGVAEKIVNRLAVHLQTYIGEPKYRGALLESEEGNQVVAVAGIELRATFGIPKITQTLGAESRERLQRTLAEPICPGEGYYGVYRAALAHEDPLIQFLVLYLLLMSFFGDNQRDVDQFILRIEPEVNCEYTRPTNNGMAQETVYTRLRNQIGHNRSVPLEQTHREMIAHLGGMRTLVKRMIEELPSHNV
jgi:hypothetical protein